MQLFFEAYWGNELVSRVWVIENGRCKIDRRSFSNSQEDYTELSEFE